MSKIEELKKKLEGCYSLLLFFFIRQILLFGLLISVFIATMIYQPEGLIYPGYALMIIFILLALKHFFKALYAVFALIRAKLIINYNSKK